MAPTQYVVSSVGVVSSTSLSEECGSPAMSSVLIWLFLCSVARSVLRRSEMRGTRAACLQLRNKCSNSECRHSGPLKQPGLPFYIDDPGINVRRQKSA